MSWGGGSTPIGEGQEACLMIAHGTTFNKLHIQYRLGIALTFSSLFVLVYFIYLGGVTTRTALCPIVMGLTVWWVKGADTEALFLGGLGWASEGGVCVSYHGS